MANEPGLSTSIVTDNRQFDASMKNSEQAIAMLTAKIDKMAKQAAASTPRITQQYKAFVRNKAEATNLSAALVRLENDYLDIGNAASRSAQRVTASTRSFRLMRGQMYNASVQLQDVAVQIGAGTSAMTALSQNVPQFLSFFGPQMALVGAFVAAVPLMVAGYGALVGASKDFEKELSSGTDALDAYVGSLKTLNSSFGDSFEKITAQIEKTSVATADLALIHEQRAVAAVRATAAALADANTEASIWRKLTLRGDVSLVGDLLEIETALQGHIGVYRDNRDAVNEFIAAVRGIDEADSIDGMYQAALNVREIFLQNVDVTKKLSLEQSQFLEQLAMTIQMLEKMGAVSSTLNGGIIADQQAALLEQNAEYEAEQEEKRVKASTDFKIASAKQVADAQADLLAENAKFEEASEARRAAMRADRERQRLAAIRLYYANREAAEQEAAALERARAAVRKQWLEEEKQLQAQILQQVADEQAALLEENQRYVDKTEEAVTQARLLSGAITQINFSPALEGARALSRELNISLHAAMQMAGMLGQVPSAIVFDPRDPRYDEAAARKQRIKDRMAASVPGTVSPFDPSRLPVPSAPGRSPGGGGGGVAEVDPFIAKIEQLRESLMTEEELERQSYERRTALLEEFLQRQPEKLQEYNDLQERLQTEHQRRMAEIDVYRYGDGLQKAGAFFGDMAAAFQGGNEQMLRIAKAFGAAEALVNAWRAYSQMLADPTNFTLGQKIAAAASVLSAGFGAVQAIKGVSPGGSSSGGSGAAAGGGAAAAPIPIQTVSINLQGDTFSRASVEGLLAQIQSELDRGGRLVFS